MVLLIAVFALAVNHVLLLGGAQLQLPQPLLLSLVNDIIIRTPVWIVIFQLGHRHALPKAQLLPQSGVVDALGKPVLVLVVLAAKLAQRLVGAAGVRLHLPYLLAQAAVLAAGLVELRAVGAVPGGDVGDVLRLVVVELLEHEGDGVGVLREEGGVGVAAVLGPVEGFRKLGDDAVEVGLLGCERELRVS